MIHSKTLIFLPSQQQVVDVFVGIGPPNLLDEAKFDAVIPLFSVFQQFLSATGNSSNRLEESKFLSIQ